MVVTSASQSTAPKKVALADIRERGYLSKLCALDGARTLLFEIVQQKALYPAQVEKLPEVFGTCEGPLASSYNVLAGATQVCPCATQEPRFLSQTWEFAMGMGKTEIFGPLLAAQHADGFHLSVVVFLDSQFDTGSENLKNFLNALGRKVFILEYSRATHSYAASLAALGTLQNAIEQQAVVVCRARDLHVLDTLTFLKREELNAGHFGRRVISEAADQFGATSKGALLLRKSFYRKGAPIRQELDILHQIRALLNSRGVILFDEVDDQLLSRNKFIMPLIKNVHAQNDKTTLTRITLETLVGILVDSVSSSGKEVGGKELEDDTSSLRNLLEKMVSNQHASHYREAGEGESGADRWKRVAERIVKTSLKTLFGGSKGLASGKDAQQLAEYMGVSLGQDSPCKAFFSAKYSAQEGFSGFLSALAGYILGTTAQVSDQEVYSCILHTWKKLGSEELEAGEVSRTTSSAAQLSFDELRDKLQVLGILQNAFATDLLLESTTKVPNQDYGFSILKPSLWLAMPYRSSRTPKEESREQRALFQNPAETVLKTTILYFSTAWDEIPLEDANHGSRDGEDEAGTQQSSYPKTAMLLEKLFLVHNSGRTTYFQDDAEKAVSQGQKPNQKIAYKRYSFYEEARQFFEFHKLWKRIEAGDESQNESQSSTIFEQAFIEKVALLIESERKSFLFATTQQNDAHFSEKKKGNVFHVLGFFLIECVFREQLEFAHLAVVSTAQNLGKLPLTFRGFSGSRKDESSWPLHVKRGKPEFTNANIGQVLMQMEKKPVVAGDAPNVWERHAVHVLLESSKEPPSDTNIVTTDAGERLRELVSRIVGGLTKSAADFQKKLKTTTSNSDDGSSKFLRHVSAVIDAGALFNDAGQMQEVACELGKAFVRGGKADLKAVVYYDKCDPAHPKETKTAVLGIQSSSEEGERVSGNKEPSRCVLLDCHAGTEWKLVAKALQVSEKKDLDEIVLNLYDQEHRRGYAIFLERFHPLQTTS